MGWSRWGIAALCIACGNSHNPSAPDAGVVVSEACRRARELRAAAVELDRGGHELLARAKLDEANAQCSEERAGSASLELRLLADLGDCARAAAVPLDAGAESKASCEARTAPSRGTDATMRAKMREAFAAGRAKDFARSESLYLDAWAEKHPNPVALEDAARMAGLGGDAVLARRLRDRALFEAESTEHAVAIVTNRVRASDGSGRLVAGTLTIADGGRIVARDPTTGELRVMLDADERWVRLSPLGTLAVTSDSSDELHRVYDLLTGQRILEHERLTSVIASPNDERLLVHGPDGPYRIVDVATGVVRTKLAAGLDDLVPVGFESNGNLVVFAGAATDGLMLREWDVDKNAFGAWLAAPSSRSVARVSANGKYLVSLGVGEYDDMPLVLRDLESHKTVAQWSGHFGGLDGFDVTADGATLATGSRNSVRLWTVADKKQTFVASRTRRGDNYDDDLGAYAFSDDGKTVVLGREARTMLWDVATGKETEIVSNQRDQEVLRAVPFGDGGMVFVLDDSVRVVPASGEVQTLCRGFHQRFYPDVGPTNAVLSPSGRSLACSMNTGTVHVFDTATWKEQATFSGPEAGRTTNNGMVWVWAGVPPAVRPVDLSFSADDATLTIVNDAALFTYDAHTGKQTSKVALRDPKLPLARRHARFADGRVLVKTANGSAALFDGTGAYQRTLALVPGARVDAPDAFSTDGKRYAVVIGNTLHRVDLETDQDRASELPVAGAAVALSEDGQTCVVVGKDGTAYRVDGATKKIEDAGAKHAFFVGKALVVVTGKGDTLDLFAADAQPKTLEVDPNGFIARDATGGFEERGRSEAECVVGRVFLTRETCADRAAKGLVDAWLRAR
jgi:WD40 repeat protein